MRLFEGTPFDIPPTCDYCGLTEDEGCVCTSEQKARIAPEKQTAKLAVESRKKGKQVTTITGLVAIANDLPQLLKLLKSACGAGGAIEGDTIEIQGDQVLKIRQELTKIGYRVK